VLDRLVNAIPSFRVLLLVSYRPGYQHAWGSRSYYTQVRLDPLPTESAKALLSDLLGEHESLEPAVQLLVERSGGNPLFLEEHVRTLVETSALVGERGAYRLATKVPVVDAAPTVQAIIGARIARLPSEDRRVLQAAAVVGQDVPVPLLQAIADLRGAALTQALERLQAAEFICETRLGSDVGYAFRHALIHEVVYASLLEQPRRLLHQRVLDALERILGDRRTERVEVLARHACAGEAWPRAAQYLYGAGEKALARAAYRIAGEFFAGAIEALERQGEGADLALKVDAYAEWWVTTVETGSASFEEHRHMAEEVVRQAERLGDSRRLVRARLQHAQFLWARGEAREGGGLEPALEQAREAFRLAPIEDLRTRSYARLLAGATCHDLGRLGEALKEFDAGAALFGTESSSEPDSLARPILANLWSWRAETLADLGHLRRAVESAGAAAGTAAQGGHSASMLVAESFLGHVHLMRGDAETSLPHIERALALAEEHGVRHALVANRHGLAHALSLLGRPRDGLHQLARAREVESSPSVGVQWAKYRTVAASAYLTAGQLDQAGHEVESGYSLAVAHGARAYLPALLRLRAEIALAGGRRLEEAAQSLDTGLVIAEEVGLRAEEGCRRSRWSPSARHGLRS
jgi:tetratricopeptide (TPR) repeat protein